MSGHRNHSRGFSLIEMMIVITVLSVIMAAIFSQITIAQQRNSVEQARLDLFQEARQFMDQLTQDLHQAGYPNKHNFGPGQLHSDLPSDGRVAVGLVKIAPDELIFEGDITGDGTVSTVQYKLDNNGPNCPCLKRSAQPKMDGLAPGPSSATAGVGGQREPDFQVEVTNVSNNIATQPIFTAYQAGDANTPVTLPTGGLYWNPGSATQALFGSINTVKVNLVVQAKVKDPTTRLTPTASLAATVRLNNCSLAPSSTFFDCSY
jgi:prepilin-type N-terminal cleavage/methylation domain-containing protein